MSGKRRGVRVGFVAGVAGFLFVSVVAGALGSEAGPRQVPVSARLVGHLVTAPVATAASARRHVVPLRVRDATRYARAKAAANRAYAAWAASHPFLSPTGPLVSVSLNKPGLGAVGAGGSTPPDTTGAIGPASYLEFVNSEIAVYSRTTLATPPIASAGEDSFTGSTGTCDGQIKWDQAAQRFEYYSLDCAATAGSNGFSFGWSKTASPTPLTGSSANWCKFHVNTGANLEDYGKLGNDNSFMIVGANEFNDTTGYTASPIFAITKPANKVTTCPSSLLITKFTPAASAEFTPVPANIFGGSANGFIPAISGSSSSALRMYTLSGTTTPTLTDNGNITVPTYNVPAGVPQPGTTDKIDSSDTRLTQTNAVFDPALKAFGIWTQHTIAGANGGPSVVRWYELKAGQTTPVQTGTIAITGAFVFNGAISPTAVGNAAAIDYNVGSSTLKVQVRARIHPFGAALGTMSSESTLATSPGIQNDFTCPSQDGNSSTSCRWGDYAGASFDPNGCGASIWGTNELNGTADGFGDAEWATQNFSLLVDECPTAAFTVTTVSPTHGTPTAFDASTSSDPDGSIPSYIWSFGDGTTQTTTTPTITHTYATAGTFTAKLTVRDAAALHTSITHSVIVS
jgi:PKD repeat protein